MVGKYEQGVLRKALIQGTQDYIVISVTYDYVIMDQVGIFQV